MISRLLDTRGEGAGLQQVFIEWLSKEMAPINPPLPPKKGTVKLIKRNKYSVFVKKKKGFSGGGFFELSLFFSLPQITPVPPSCGLKQPPCFRDIYTSKQPNLGLVRTQCYIAWMEVPLMSYKETQHVGKVAFRLHHSDSEGFVLRGRSGSLGPRPPAPPGPIPPPSWGPLWCCGFRLRAVLTEEEQCGNESSPVNGDVWKTVGRPDWEEEAFKTCWKVRNSSFNTLHAKFFSYWKRLQGFYRVKAHDLHTAVPPCIKRSGHLTLPSNEISLHLAPTETKGLNSMFVMQVMNEINAAVCLIMVKYGYKTGFNYIYITTHSATVLLWANPSTSAQWRWTLTWESVGTAGAHIEMNWRNVKLQQQRIWNKAIILQDVSVMWPNLYGAVDPLTQLV